MMLHAILRAKTDGMTSAGDIVLALVSDEESGGDQGGRWLVEDHPELFAGIKYSIGEGGWFSFQIGAAVLPDHGHRETGLPSSGDLPGHRRPRIAGHTTQPNDRDSPVPTAGNFRTHVTSETRNNVPGHRQTCLAACPCRNSGPVQSTIHGLDVETDGRQGPYIKPIVPKYRHSHIGTGRDRILPNLSPELLMSELRGIAGPDSEIEVLSHDSGLQRPDLGLFETLSDVLKERDPDGIPVLMPGSTDGRLFAPLGIQNYGFLPMLLPETFDFAATIMGLMSVCR